MTTLPPRITAGVDTHLDVHVAAALDPHGALLGVASFDTTGRLHGAARLVARLGEVEPPASKAPAATAPD